jgi:HEAT repeat protein
VSRAARPGAALVAALVLPLATAPLYAGSQSRPSVETRRDAAARLGALEDAGATGGLVRLLEDPSEIVRATAAGQLGRRGDPSSAAFLASRLGRERRAFVRKEIAYALGAVADRSATAPLVARLEREKDREVRAAIAHALGEIGDSAGVAPLMRLLGDKDEFVRRQAVVALGRLGGPADTIAERLSGDASPDVRRHAAEALGRLGGPRAASALEGALRDDDPYVAAAAAAALDRLKGEIR